MPNWCDTTVIIEGDKEKIKSLYGDLAVMGSEGFDFEYLLSKYELDPDEYNHRRVSIEDIYYDEDENRIHLELRSAWDIDEDMLHDVFEFYDEDGNRLTTMYFMYEIEGNLGYATNDDNGKYFKNKFALSYSFEDDFGREYFDSEKEMIDFINESLNTNLSTLDDISELNKKLNEEDSDHYCEFYKIDIVD